MVSVSGSGYRPWVRRVRVQPHVRRFLGEHVDVWMCGCVVWVGGAWWMVDGMAAHIPSVTHEVESRQLQGQNVVQGAMRNVEGADSGRSVPVVNAGWICPTEVEVLATILAVLETSVTQS